MLAPVKLVIPEPLPVITPPLLTIRLVETVTLEVNVCAAVQVFVELNSALMSAAGMVALTSWLEPLVFTYWLLARLLTVADPRIAPEVTASPPDPCTVALDPT